MTSDDQILTQIREKVDHPATVKELLQRLKWPREQRASFKRARILASRSADGSTSTISRAIRSMFMIPISLE
jgi:hypothetical protein